MMAPIRVFVHGTNRLFQFLAGLAVVFIVCALGYDLVARNMFNAPTLWAMDLSRFALVFVFFLGIAPALEKGAHVGVDLLATTLRPRAQAALKVFALFLVVVFATVLLWQVTKLTMDIFARGGRFPTVIPIERKHVYWIGPVGVAQFLLTALVMLHDATRQFVVGRT